MFASWEASPLNLLFIARRSEERGVVPPWMMTIIIDDDRLVNFAEWSVSSWCLHSLFVCFEHHGDSFVLTLLTIPSRMFWLLQLLFLLIFIDSFPVHMSVILLLNLLFRDFSEVIVRAWIELLLLMLKHLLSWVWRFIQLLLTYLHQNWLWFFLRNFLRWLILCIWILFFHNLLVFLK